MIYNFHYDYIKDKYDSKSKLSFTGTDSFMCEIKTEDVYKDFSNDKEMFDFSNYSTKSKYYDNWNKLVIGNMKDKTGSVTTKEFVGFLYSFLVENSSVHKKAKDENANVVAPTSHNEYKDALLYNKCIRHSMNRIQSKDHRIGT